ncbi:MAG: hypothetical protein SGILL_009831, partial [Bacillariaceae sp.]
LSLKDFTASKGDSLLGVLHKEPIAQDPSIPQDPSSKDGVPALLLYDLKNKDHKGTATYRFIEETVDICSGLYGPSGAGKTRAIYEYLSHNYGLYFAGKTTNDLGSKDLSELIEMFQRNHVMDALEFIEVEGDSQAEDFKKNLLKKRLSRNERNLCNMERYVMIMVYIRRVVFDAINKQLEVQKKPILTPYDWLLVQLFPRQALGGKDLFLNVLLRCLVQVNKHRDDSSVSNALVLKGEEWTSPLMVVDEAQVLLRKLTNFFLTENGTKERAALSAVLKAMSNIPGLLQSEVGFPLVAGTGMSRDDIREASDSSMAKRPNTRRTTIFMLATQMQ